MKIEWGRRVVVTVNGAQSEGDDSQTFKLWSEVLNKSIETSSFVGQVRFCECNFWTLSSEVWVVISTRGAKDLHLGSRTAKRPHDNQTHRLVARYVGRPRLGQA